MPVFLDALCNIDGDTPSQVAADDELCNVTPLHQVYIEMLATSLLLVVPRPDGIDSSCPTINFLGRS